MSEAKRVALDFMRAFWRSDLDAAEAMLAPDATWVFQLGMPYAAEGGRVWPLAEAMRRIVADLFTAFDPERGFAVELTSAIAEGGEVALEYSATGWIRGGAEYRNHYAARLTVRAGRVAELRPYNDTKHMLDALVGADQAKA